jgi:hypothetical protein
MFADTLISPLGHPGMISQRAKVQNVLATQMHFPREFCGGVAGALQGHASVIIAVVGRSPRTIVASYSVPEIEDYIVSCSVQYSAYDNGLRLR